MTGPVIKAKMPATPNRLSDAQRVDRIEAFVKPYRDAFDRAGLTIIADSDTAKRLLATFVVWPLPQWKRPSIQAPKDPKQRWLWLWDGFKGGWRAPDFLEDIALAARMPWNAAANVWPALVASRVIYPDGTIAEGARVLLDGFVTKQLPRQRAATPEKKGSSDEQRKPEETRSDASIAVGGDGGEPAAVVDDSGPRADEGAVHGASEDVP